MSPQPLSLSPVRVPSALRRVHAVDAVHVLSTPDGSALTTRCMSSQPVLSAPYDVPGTPNLCIIMYGVPGTPRNPNN
jgi:hypothetical protein